MLAAGLVRDNPITMPSSWETFGHDLIKQTLGKQLAAGIFPHAYLFYGPEGVGKKTLALEFTQKILDSTQLNQHPDFQILEEGGQISVERIRDFIASLSFKPFLAKKKVAIINDAQNLNLQSSNALLKTLEEPKPGTILILIASGRQLLPTIVSRCQAFNFNLFTEKQLREYAALRGLETSGQTAALSFGSISKLVRLAQDNNFSRETREKIESFEKLQAGTAADRLLAIANFSDMETEALEQTIACWYFWQAGNLRDRPLKYKVVEALGEALVQLQGNKNKKLILQGLFMKI
jgi:DNA polymerase III subunit delta'